MFFSPPQHASGPTNSTPMIYHVDGHEFVSDPSAVRIACRKCGQDSTEAFLSLAIATGRQGLYSQCSGAVAALSIDFEPPVALSPAVMAKDCCLDCGRELSRSYLDCYFGRDPMLKDLCRDCRDHRQKNEVRFFSFAEN